MRKMTKAQVTSMTGKLDTRQVRDSYDKECNAWQDGFRNGQADRKLGLRIDYVWYSLNSANDYTRFYAHGYRYGWRYGSKF